MIKVKRFIYFTPKSYLFYLFYQEKLNVLFFIEENKSLPHTESIVSVTRI